MSINSHLYDLGTFKMEEYHTVNSDPQNEKCDLPSELGKYVEESGFSLSKEDDTGKDYKKCIGIWLTN